MSEDKVEALYKTFARLADETAEKDPRDYELILKSVSGSSKEKILACQFIPRFFSAFPDLSNQALEAHLDLCEDEDVHIRKLAVKELPSICRQSPALIYKISDILSQLLIVKDAAELGVVTETLMSIVRINISDAVKGIYHQVKTGEDEVREKCLKFFGAKVLGGCMDIITPSIVDDIIVEIKSLFVDATPEEIVLSMSYLWRLGLGRTPEGKLKFLNIVSEILKYLQKGEFSDEEAVDYFNTIVKQTRSMIKVTNPTDFLLIFSDVVLPKMKCLKGYSEGSPSVLETLKIVAELVNSAEVIDSKERLLAAFHPTLMEFLPVTASESGSSSEEPKLLFSYVECLLFVVHKLARGYPRFYTQYQDRLYTIKQRLHSFARALQGFIKSLKESVGEQDMSNPTPDSELKAVALKTTTNINQLTKDFFYGDPDFRTAILLSWHPLKNKRPQTEINQPPNPPKKSRTTQEVQLYQPPSGKYSSSINQFPESGNTSTSQEPQFMATRRPPSGRRWNNGPFKRGNFQRWT